MVCSNEGPNSKGRKYISHVQGLACIHDFNRAFNIGKHHIICPSAIRRRLPEMGLVSVDDMRICNCLWEFIHLQTENLS